MKYTSKDRKQLRGLAHALKPVVQIGKNGVTEQLVKSIKAALLAHELIKIKFIDNKELKKELAEKLATDCKALLVGIIGNTAILYRQQPDKEKRRVVLTGAAE
ncbi:ribosome assembly RNA-binding protein YhbY [bacterium]|nr:ribosome assembly RNA-binding protein YhbY [bacterium]